MNTLTDTATRIRVPRAYRPTSALAQRVTFDEALMFVHFADGRVLGVPLIWFPLLFAATPAQRENYEIGYGGLSLHWPDIDEDIQVAGLLAGGQPV